MVLSCPGRVQCRYGISQRLYDEFLRPLLLVGLFAPPEQISAAAMLETFYFYSTSPTSFSLSGPSRLRKQIADSFCYSCLSSIELGLAEFVDNERSSPGQCIAHCGLLHVAMKLHEARKPLAYSKAGVSHEPSGRCMRRDSRSTMNGGACPHPSAQRISHGWKALAAPSQWHRPEFPSKGSLLGRPCSC